MKNEKELQRFQIGEARANLSDIVNSVRWTKEPVILKNRDKEVAMIVSMDLYDEVMKKFLEG